MIGKSAKPRCFKNVKTLPVVYASNKKAWMTSDLFLQLVKKFDEKMTAQKRKVILFMDNCTAHNNLPEFESVTVEFFPPNTTSRLQPLDQGIIKNFKCFYRREVVKKHIDDAEAGKKTSINLLDAIRFSDKSWRNVTARTIQNCFKTCGFEIKSATDNEAEESDANNEGIIEGIDADQWKEIVCEPDFCFDDYVNIDDGVAICGLLSDDDILASSAVKCDENENSDDDEPHNEKVIISAKQARCHVDDLRSFVENSSDANDDIFNVLYKLEKFIEKSSEKRKKQNKITNYFANVLRKFKL